MRERTIVVAIVMVLHAAVLVAWVMQPHTASGPQRELEVIIAIAAAPDGTTAQTPQPETVKAVSMPPQRLLNPEPTPVQFPVLEQPVAQAAATPVVQPDVPEPVAAPVPVLQSVQVEASEEEPEYKAAYLNNHLTYPPTAMRMGWQGRVVLNVEVLADGSCGQLNILQGSGHNMLDQAAMQTVKDWRFSPARVGGKPITKWFRIGVTYSLKDKDS
jgi:protein TonB